MWQKTKLEMAIEFAKKNHEGQKRKSGEPYIIHPIAVMEILKRYDFPEDILISWILHDVVEDTEIKNLYIRDNFWDRVGFITHALTKNKKPKKKHLLDKYKKVKNKFSTFEEFIDYRFHIYLNRLHVWIIADPWIMYVKIADQIHNVSTLEYVSEEKKKRKIEELEVHFIPLYEESRISISDENIEKFEILFQELKDGVKNEKENL